MANLNAKIDALILEIQAHESTNAISVSDALQVAIGRMSKRGASVLGISEDQFLSYTAQRMRQVREAVETARATVLTTHAAEIDTEFAKIVIPE